MTLTNLSTNNQGIVYKNININKTLNSPLLMF